MRFSAFCLGLVVLMMGGAPGSSVNAQGFPIYQTPGGVASLDRDRLFRESVFGSTQLGLVEEQSEVLTAENQAIQKRLEEEERALTELRKTTEPEQFTVLAAEFDIKVKRIRSEQESKRTELRNMIDTSQREFNETAAPILRQLMEDRGIVFILDQSAIVISQSYGDITDEAIARIDAELKP